MKKLLLTITFAIFSTNVTAQDFNKGLEAYKAGDYATALKEWKPLAEQGNAYAQANLGLMYNNGKGVLKDSIEAVKWYRLSAEQGNVGAQSNIGMSYFLGDGVLKDTTEALKWFRMSAEQGDSNGQNWLGIMYNFGDGVLKDNSMAHMWYNIASANGNESTGESRDRLEDSMTPEDISKATAMARECMNSDYKKCGY